MAQQWITLDNGFKYNPKTGETVLEGQDKAKPEYWYNPTTNKTTYGGQSYAGKLDPYVLAAMNEQDITSAGEKHQGYLDAAFGKLETNPFLQTESSQQNAINPISGTYNALTFSSAYDAARKRQPRSFFDEVKSTNFGEETKVPTTANIDAYRELMAQRYGSDPTKASQYQKPLTAETPEQPTKPQTPIQPETSDSNTQPDWKSLYEQLQGMFSQQSQPNKPRETIGSFQQWGPQAIQRRQQSYVSSTPYGSKGS